MKSIPHIDQYHPLGKGWCFREEANERSSFFYFFFCFTLLFEISDPHPPHPPPLPNTHNASRWYQSSWKQNRDCKPPPPHKNGAMLSLHGESEPLEMEIKSITDAIMPVGSQSGGVHNGDFFVMCRVALQCFSHDKTTSMLPLVHFGPRNIVFIPILSSVSSLLIFKQSRCSWLFQYVNAPFPLSTCSLSTSPQRQSSHGGKKTTKKTTTVNLIRQHIHSYLAVHGESSAGACKVTVLVDTNSGIYTPLELTKRLLSCIHSFIHFPRHRFTTSHNTAATCLITTYVNKHSFCPFCSYKESVLLWHQKDRGYLLLAINLLHSLHILDGYRIPIQGVKH